MADPRTTPVGELTFEDVVTFCRLGIPEDERLEYKQRISSDKPFKQVAKEVVAFANTQGGCIVFGVEETDRRPKPDQKGIDLGKNTRQTILTICAQVVCPPVPVEVSDFLTNLENGDLGFLVVQVPASGDAPHSAGTRLGIYTRVSDQSEPATPDEVIRMADRRRHAMAAQDRRREFARDTLARSAPLQQPRPATVWMSIGPLVDAAPLFTLSELRGGIEKYCVSTRRGRRTIPFKHYAPPIGVLDGLYSVDDEHVGLVDIYGNITTCMCRKSFGTSELISTVSDDARRIDGKILYMRTPHVFGQILATLESARELYRLAGFYGQLRASVCIDDVRNVTLCAGHGRVLERLGECGLNETITVEETLEAATLADDLAPALSPIARRVLWAWGCTHDSATDWCVQDTEIEHYGSVDCGCRRWQMPVNKKKCWVCRKRDVN